MELLECVSLSGGAETEYPTLANAPITEALIDVRVRLPHDTDLARLESFQDTIQDRFPEKHSRMSVEARIEVTKQGRPELIAPSPAAPDGFLFRSTGENLVVQARLDGFTLSKLKPYENWRQFCTQFVDLWNRYVDVAKPTRITRIALRYINRLELPLGANLKTYILTVPDVAPGIPELVPRFYMRLVIPHPNGSIAIVTETVADTTPDSAIYPLIFDIDVFREVDLPTEDRQLWDVVRDLRKYKNEIFFRSIPRAKELFA